MNELLAYAIDKAKEFTDGGNNPENTEQLSKLLNDHLEKAKGGSAGDMNVLVDFYDKHLSPTPKVSSDKGCPRCVNTIKSCFEAIENFFAS